MRHNVINFLCETYYNNDCTYLEIGVENPENCFDIIRARKKTSVDPQKIRDDVEIEYLMTSDLFFEKLERGETEFSPDHKWDVIFIDGLHLAEQVYRDIHNAVKHCKGFIVMHDCAPANVFNAHSDYEHFLDNYGVDWNGTTWKAFYKFRTETALKTYTVDVDHGIGVIEMNSTGDPIPFENKWFEYGTFKNNMVNDLGLITPMEFINMHSMRSDYMTRLKGFVQKGWGHELIWATNDKYCGKLMKFNKGAKFSMHFHAVKDETWHVLSGRFKVHMIDTRTARNYSYNLIPGDTHRVYPLQPHQIECVEEGTIIEVSTPDSVEDNYRIIPGDSQKENI